MSVRVKDGEVGDITLRNVLSFSYLRDVKIQTERFGYIKVDLAYGGTFYAIIRAEDIGLEIVPNQAGKIIEYGEILRKIIQKQVKIIHPKGSSFTKVLQIQFTAPPMHAKAHMKNVVIVPPAGIDRSPCGTGTSARMADLFAKEKLHVGDEFIHESITGTLFRGKIVSESQEGKYPAIIPEVTGTAYITGFQQLVAEIDDPFKRGFLLA
jgi:proline racemase